MGGTGLPMPWRALDNVAPHSRAPVAGGRDANGVAPAAPGAPHSRPPDAPIRPPRTRAFEQVLGVDARERRRVEVDRDQIGPAAGLDPPGLDARAPRAPPARGRRRAATPPPRPPGVRQDPPRPSRSRWPYSSQRISSSESDAGIGVGAQAQCRPAPWTRSSVGMPSPRLASVSGQRHTVPPGGQKRSMSAGVACGCSARP